LGTSISDTVSITVSEPPSIALAGDDQTICGNRATLAANAPTIGTGTWSILSGNGEFVDASDPLTTVAGLDYGVTGLIWTIKTEVCISTDTLFVTATEVPFLNIPSDTSICENQQPLVLSIAFSANAQLQWNVLSGAALISSEQTTTPKLSGLPRGLTQIEVIATNGDCEVRDTINITVNGADSPECRNNELIVPKGFSPNGDGTADFFIIENLNGRNAQLEVFNRWGQKVYEAENYQNNWDGTANAGVVLYGEQLPEGTYYYLLTIEGEDQTRKDFITLWR
jgi:gliding motility-associated-like protein